MEKRGEGNNSSNVVLYMGTYPPRECGIATFTRDITEAINKKFDPLIKSRILAMNKPDEIYNYPKEVIYQISEDDMKDYIEVAKRINQNPSIKLINIQHEFGLFGGEYGDYLLTFLEIVKKPVVVTFHSVLPNPDKRAKKVVKSIAEKSQTIIVMTKKAVEILKEKYGIDTEIRVIPHGIPTVSFETENKEKAKLGYKDKILLSSFGLINEGKGYEYIIKSLPKVVKKFPNLLYLIIGETHPVVRREEGERYRRYLQKLVREKNLKNNVKFYNKYVTLQEIIQYLKATDIYISSSLSPHQITSGTLVYAMGCGKPVISTPFLHAKDIVTPERGSLVKFRSAKSFTEAIVSLISNEELRRKMERNAYSYTRHMTWPNVAIAYGKIFKRYINIWETESNNLPKIKTEHLRNLTDNFGIIQFANYTQPDIESGYTLDDNARALLVSCMLYEKSKKNLYLKQIKKYLKFIRYVQRWDGKLFNLVNKDKKINRRDCSDDAQGRAIWSLGYTLSIKELPEEIKEDAKEIFIKAMGENKKIKSARAAAFTLLGMYFYDRKYPSRLNIKKINSLAEYLIILYNTYSDKEWKWFENYLTYANSKLSEALLYAYMATRNKKYLKIGLESLDFLISKTFSGKDTFVPIGQNGWYERDQKKSLFDQQPIDVGYMVQTLLLAYKITKDEKYEKYAIKTFQWFLGKNTLNQVVYNEITGGCYDGVGEFSLNLNQGAESALSYLLARLSFPEETF